MPTRKRTRTPPRNKYQDAVMKKEELSDWYGDVNREKLMYFDAWRQQANMMPGTSTLPNDVSVQRILSAQKHRTDLAHTFYLSTEIAHLVHGASQKMPPHRMVEDDFPTPHGFIWLETPLNFQSVDDVEPILIRAITWSREHIGTVDQSQGPGVVLWEHQDTRLARARPGADTWPSRLFDTPLFPAMFGTIRDGRLPWTCWDVETAASNPLDAVTAAFRSPSVKKAYLDFTSSDDVSEDFVPIPPGSEVIKEGISDGHWVVRVPEGALIHYEPDHIDRFLQTFCLFLRQELPALHVEPRELPQPMGKRFREKNQNDSPISIVTWRRRERGEYNKGTGRKISYRFVRRDYWKHENYRTIDGVRMRYPIWIPATIVGDPSLPFRNREVVNKVSR